jgi:integrase
VSSLIQEPERPRKPWRVDWIERRRRHTRRFATKREAKIFAGDLERGERAVRQGRLILTEWLEHWLRTEGVAWEPVTRHERADRIDKLIVPHLGRLRLTEITRSEVRSWRAVLVREGATLYTADRAVQILSAALGAAFRDDLIRDNPCRGLGRIYRPVQRRRAAQPLEVELIRAQMRFPRDRVMASLMAYAGLRPAEMRSLRWEDVQERSVVVRSATASDGREKRTKTGGERAIPIIAPLADDLAELHAGDAQPESGIVAPFHTDHRNWTTRVWRPARVRAGLDVPPYALRHTFASLLIAEGRNPWQVASLMGHSNPQMVITTYGHLFAEAELAEARSMEETAVEARQAASISRAISAK